MLQRLITPRVRFLKILLKTVKFVLMESNLAMQDLVFKLSFGTVKQQHGDSYCLKKTKGKDNNKNYEARDCFFLRRQKNLRRSSSRLSEGQLITGFHGVVRFIPGAVQIFPIFRYAVEVLNVQRRICKFRAIIIYQNKIRSRVFHTRQQMC